jgi:hypothetical protein
MSRSTSRSRCVITVMIAAVGIRFAGTAPAREPAGTGTGTGTEKNAVPAARLRSR